MSQTASVPDSPSTGFTGGSEVSSWRSRSPIVEDRLWAVDSLYGSDDFSNRAILQDTPNRNGSLKIDLLIQNVHFTMNEHIMHTAHIGETFSAVPFGKAPLELQAQAVLADTQITYGKQFLIDAYKNKLRLSAAARTGNTPALFYLNSMVLGPLVSMRVTESSNSADTCLVTFSMLVELYLVYGEDGPLVFDYRHATETPYRSIMEQAAQPDAVASKENATANKGV